MDGIDTALRIYVCGSYIFTDLAIILLRSNVLIVTNADRLSWLGSDTFYPGDAAAITIQHYLVYWILVVVQNSILRNICFIRMAVVAQVAAIDTATILLPSPLWLCVW